MTPGQSRNQLDLGSAAFGVASLLTVSALVAAGSLMMISIQMRRRPFEVYPTNVNRIGAVSGAIVILGSGAALFAMNRFVHLPLLRLSAAISAFGSGSKQARAQ